MTNTMRNFWIGITAAFLLVFASMGQAKEAPDVLLKRVTQDLIVELRKQDKTLRDNSDNIYPIIDRILVPYIDWHAMAQWVVGRNAWMKASDAQKKQFSNEFKDLLIRTYASTLRAYNNQTIEYFPLRGSAQGKTRVQVASRILESGREPIRVNYRLADKGDSWKVYDISIEGVSLLRGFQQQFSQEIQQGGLDNLIKRLHQHNEKPLK